MTYGRFTVTDHNYLNTGGNTMVSIFAVYDSTDNVTRFVIANEDCFWFQTADTISSELQLDNDELYAKVVIGEWPWDALVTDPSFDQHQFEDDEWYLFKYCQFEFYKKDCKYFNTKYRLQINELPADLHCRLSDDYIEWANREGVGCLTDGFDVFMDDDYTPPIVLNEMKPMDVEIARKLQELKNFRQWFASLLDEHATEEKMQELYESYITVAVAGNSIKLEFDAENYNNLLHLIDRAIEEF